VPRSTTCIHGTGRTADNRFVRSTATGGGRLRAPAVHPAGLLPLAAAELHHPRARADAEAEHPLHPRRRRRGLVAAAVLLVASFIGGVGAGEEPAGGRRGLDRRRRGPAGLTKGEAAEDGGDEADLYPPELVPAAAPAAAAGLAVAPGAVAERRAAEVVGRRRGDDGGAGARGQHAGGVGVLGRARLRLPHEGHGAGPRAVVAEGRVAQGRLPGEQARVELAVVRDAQRALRLAGRRRRAAAAGAALAGSRRHQLRPSRPRPSAAARWPVEVVDRWLVVVVAAWECGTARSKNSSASDPMGRFYTRGHLRLTIQCRTFSDHGAREQLGIVTSARAYEMWKGELNTKRDGSEGECHWSVTSSTCDAVLFSYPAASLCSIFGELQ
jgi:hypothetical protein